MPIKSEFPSVPVATEPFTKTFLDALWSHHVENPKKLAMINAKNELDNVTYGDLYLYSYSIASYLETKDFGHRDTSCLVLSNSWQFISILFGTAIQGGTTSPASYMFTEYELQKQFKDCRCKIVFCAESIFETVYNAVQNVPQISTIVVVADNPDHQKCLPLTGNSRFEIVKFEEVIRTTPNLRPRKNVHHRIDKDVFILPYSSGTTGTPKGVMISHKNFGTMMRIQTDHMNKIIASAIDGKYNSKDEYNLLLLPFYHIFGIGIVVSRLLEGSTGVFMQGFEPNLFCSVIEKFKIKVLLLVPPILLFLSKSPIVEKYDLSSVNFIFSGAAPAGKDLFIELMNKYRNLRKIAQGYGMTELSLGSIFPVLTDSEERYESSGKLLPNFEMKIVDITTGKEVGLNTPGELYFRGPTIMLGYLNQPQATAETIDNEGWLKSGDIGYIDKNGFVYIIDRLKELIKVRGYQVPPAELEDLLLSNPRIKDCAVIGIEDENDGELPKAYVVKSDNSLQAEDVQNFVKDRVAHYKQLKGGVEFVTEIAKSPTGKILRRFLRDKHNASVKEKRLSKI